MNRHPGGESHTLQMLELSMLQPPARILDFGAGDGETVSLLRSLGYLAEGIDLNPGSIVVQQGDFLHPPYSGDCFDGIISQCAFYVSGNQNLALAQAYRMLRNDGILMLSDVWFSDAASAAEAAGFRILFHEDLTRLWREYYLNALWTEDSVPCGIRGKCTYEMLICSKD